MLKSALLLMALIAIFWAAPVQAEDIAIIINGRVDVNSISPDDVREIYRGKIQFLAGKRLKPIDQAEDQEIRKVFLGEILHITKSEYTKHWMHLVFLEGTNAPVLRDDSTAVIDAVREMEGAVGYIWSSEAVHAKGVKVISTLHTTAKK